MKNLVSEARKKRTLNEAFHNEAGAIDLASIMVGIIVIGLIGGVIAATVFAVIPWSQDNAARDQLSRVVQAVHSATAVNGGNYTENVSSYIDIQSVGATVISNNPGCYGAFLKSSSGRYYYASNQSSNPTAVPSPWPNTKPSNYPANCNWPSSGENIGQPMATYTNVFVNPSFRNGTSQTESSPNIARSITTASPSGDSNALLATRTSTGAARFSLLASSIQPNNSYTVVMTLEASQAETVQVQIRPNVTTNSSVQIIGTVDLTPNTPQTVSFTATAQPGVSYTNSGVTILSNNGPENQVFKLDNVTIVQNADPSKPYTSTHFDGSNGGVWVGTPDNSQSTTTR